jgi:uncharacterized protein (DUF885 family)
MDRRLFLQSSSAVAAGALANGAVAAAPAPPGIADQALAAKLQQCAQTFLAHAPEEATTFGFDVGAHAALRSQLNDRSPGAMAAQLADAKQTLASLSRIDGATLSVKGARNQQVAIFVYETFADLLGRYGYIDLNLRPSPYVVSQMNGAYYWLPDFIGSKHPLETRADVQAWCARLNALGVALDQETDRIRHDAAMGVAPPGFIIDETTAQIAKLRDGSPRSSALLAPAIARAAKAGLGDIGPRGEAIFKAVVAPALTRQTEALTALRATAADTAGVWRLPDGEAYYGAALRANTTLDTGAEDLHAAGLAQVAALIDEIDRSLRAQGLSAGSVGARIDALNRAPRFLVSEDDAGRTRLMALARAELDDVTARLPRAFNNPVVDPIVVHRVPIAVEAGAPAAFYSEGAAGQPGSFMLNLARPSDYPVWRLPTLTHHEGVPGHHFQFGIVRRAGALPLFSRMLQFSAYTEGWALYAQQVADEIGVYETDPFGRIGYLQSELFRAARIVVDTGLHHKRWTREQAVAWMVTQIGETPDATRREIDRYCVYPGQACSFKAGANAIVAAREDARRRLGARFDIRTFHDLVLNAGPVPMAVLQATIAQWKG